jgi:predicted nucleic acid-binding protein
VIYLDTSALAKLVVDEPESEELASWLDERPAEVLVTSALARVELVRAATRRSPETVPAARALLAELATVPIDALVLETATSLPPVELRSLDAVHLASAATLVANAEGLVFVAYDERLLTSASALGLETSAPGRKASP